MNIIILDKSQPDIAEALADCEVGVPKTLTLTVTPTVDSDVFVATVDSVEYSESEPGGEPAEPEGAGEAPYKPKAKRASAIAVEE